LLRNRLTYIIIARNRIVPNIWMMVCKMVASEFVLTSSLEDKYSNGMVRKALAIAIQPAIFRFLEIKS
jgi:hypothetical protein